MEIISYIVIKDLSIWIMYFITLKYNIGETYTSDIVKDFPAAPYSTIPEILIGALYITWIPLLFDLGLTGVINFWLSKKQGWVRINQFLKGVLLHIPIFSFWILMFIYGNIELNKASLIALLISFLFAGLIKVAFYIRRNTHNKTYIA